MWGAQAPANAHSETGERRFEGEGEQSGFSKRQAPSRGKTGMRFKRLAVVAFVLFVLSFFFLNTWQGYRYERLEASVAALGREQEDWLERNKKIIAGLAVLSSPARVAGLAESELGLSKLERGARIKVLFGSAYEAAGPQGAAGE
jgi:hypothetical protein